MALNLLDAIKNYFNTDLIEKAAAYNGETPSTISNALKVAVPLSLAGILKKAESSPETVLSLAKGAFNSGILDKLSATFTHAGGGIPSDGPSLITGIFGDKFGSIANALSGHSGIKGATASSLFGSLIPLALGLLGKHATDNNLSPGGLATFLSGQRAAILGSVPTDFSLSNFFTFKPIAVAAAVPEVAKPSNKWLLPLILGLLALGLIWYLMKGCNKETPSTVVTDTAATIKTDTVIIGHEHIKVKLPNGKELDAYKGGIEDLLVAFLMSDTAKPGNDNWFDFNDLNFNFGTAEITADSHRQLDNITEILKAFPKVKIKIGGYTDRVGNEEANKKLSQDRADAVAAALKDEGVSAQVVGAEGYGSEFAKFPATAPDENRIKDRRISVSVREK